MTWNSVATRVLNATAKAYIILDDCSPPSPTCIQDAPAFPTDARIRQKEKHALLKAQGLKPKKKPKTVEPGDDSGNDLTGLGPDITLYGLDTLDSDSDDDEAVLFMKIPRPIADGVTNVFSAVAELCYGHDNKVDLLEICGGKAGTLPDSFQTRALVGR
jgi:hypothetical protein